MTRRARFDVRQPVGFHAENREDAERQARGWAARERIHHAEVTDAREGRAGRWTVELGIRWRSA